MFNGSINKNNGGKVYNLTVFCRYYFTYFFRSKTDIREPSTAFGEICSYTFYQSETILLPQWTVILSFHLRRLDKVLH